MYKFPIIFSQDFYIRFLEDFDFPFPFWTMEEVGYFPIYNALRKEWKSTHST